MSSESRLFLQCPRALHGLLRRPEIGAVTRPAQQGRRAAGKPPRGCWPVGCLLPLPCASSWQLRPLSSGPRFPPSPPLSTPGLAGQEHEAPVSHPEWTPSSLGLRSWSFQGRLLGNFPSFQAPLHCPAFTAGCNPGASYRAPHCLRTSLAQPHRHTLCTPSPSLSQLV